MSSSQLVDGKTGEPIGYNAYTTTTTNYAVSGGVPVTTSNYVPTTTTTYYGTGSGANANASSSYYTATGNYAVSGIPVTTTTTTTNQIVGTTVNTGKEVIKGESRIEYVPFEKKIIEYKDQAKVERVPKKVKKVEYREERKIETIPKEVTVTDYYAVEYLRQYIPQYVPEKRIEYVQVPKKQVRYEYIPVERYPIFYSDKSFTTLTRPLNKKELVPTPQTLAIKPPHIKLVTRLLPTPPLAILSSSPHNRSSTPLQALSKLPTQLDLPRLSTQPAP
jgi:hypothetical protein